MFCKTLIHADADSGGKRRCAAPYPAYVFKGYITAILSMQLNRCYKQQREKHKSV